MTDARSPETRADEPPAGEQPSPTVFPEGTTPVSDDEQRLRELGYTQELARSMSGFSNFAVSFSIVSILSGCLTLYGTGMKTGGPALIVWGWPVVGLFTLCVGLAMAEICSSYPTAAWALLLGRQAQPQPGRRVELVHRLVQLPRPGRGHRRMSTSAPRSSPTPS